jgi:protease-4
MVDGKSRDIPLIDTRLVGSYTIAKALKTARDDARVGAVVMRIESPGGSSLAADVIWREVVLTNKVKPVIVSMGTSAASGGYYIASAGRSIYANPLTITGSIGIFYGKADVSELFAKIGVNTETYKTSPRADGESIYRPYTEDELTELQKKVRQLYEIFLDRVAEGRARRSTPWAKGASGPEDKRTNASSSTISAEFGKPWRRPADSRNCRKTHRSSSCPCPKNRSSPWP